jgi:hypothetical protein
MSEALALGRSDLELGCAVRTLSQQSGSGRACRQPAPGTGELFVWELTCETVAPGKYIEEPRRGGRLPGDGSSIVVGRDARELGESLEVSAKLGKDEGEPRKGRTARLGPPLGGGAHSGQPVKETEKAARGSTPPFGCELVLS